MGMLTDLNWRTTKNSVKIYDVGE